MKIHEYLLSTEKTVNALAVRAGICPHIIHRKIAQQAAERTPKATKTAQAIEDATAGQVSTAEWLGIDPCSCVKLRQAIERIDHTDGGA